MNHKADCFFFVMQHMSFWRSCIFRIRIMKNSPTKTGTLRFRTQVHLIASLERGQTSGEASRTQSFTGSFDSNTNLRQKSTKGKLLTSTRFSDLAA